LRLSCRKLQRHSQRTRTPSENPAVTPLRRISLELNARELQVKVQAIDCHESKVEDRRIAIKNIRDLLARAYARESYIPISGCTRRLGPAGLHLELS